MAIDVGVLDFTDTGGSGSYTVINKDNPANATGVIDHIDVRTGNAMLYDIASFTDEESSVYSTNGNVTVNCIVGLNEFDAPGDFTAFNITIGDYIGVYPDSVPRQDSGVGCAYKLGDNIPCSEAQFIEPYNQQYALYGTGTEAGGGPPTGWNKLIYTSEPPTPNAWNQVKREAGTGWKKLLYI